MPTFTATQDKLNIIADTENRHLDGYYQYTVQTEAADENTTTTFSIAGLGAVGPDYFIGAGALQWVLVEAATQSIVGQYRRIVTVTPSSSPSAGSMTFTVDRAFTATITNADTVSFHRYRPDRFTTAYNRVVQTNQHVLYKLYQVDFPARSQVYDYGLPRGFTDVARVMVDAYRATVKRDRFDRDASTTDPGSGYTEAVGSFGVNSSEQLYCVSDANGDRLLLNPEPNDNLHNANIRTEMRLQGTTGDKDVYRTMAQLIAYKDSTNFLAVVLLATTANPTGAIALRKLDANSESTLTQVAVTTTTGTWFHVVTKMVGNRVSVWVDGVQYINYELTGTNTRYAEYEGAGWQVLKAGSPGTDLVVDDILVSRIVPQQELNDYEVGRDRSTLRFGVTREPYGFVDDQIVTVDGTAALSRLGADSTGALATLTTDTIEISPTDAEYDYLLAKVAAAVMRQQAMDVGPDGQLSVTSERLRQLAAEMEADAALLLPMPQVGGDLVFA